MLASQVVFALVVVASAQHFGFLRDTPEVQAEKERFFQLYEAAAAAARDAPDTGAHFTPTKHSTGASKPEAVLVVNERADVNAAIAEFRRIFNTASTASKNSR